MHYPDTRHRLTDLLKQLGVAAAYALLIHIEHSHFESDAVIGSFEPASGLALAVLLIFGKRYAGSIFFGALLANTMQTPFMEAAAISSGDTLQALCGAWLLTRNARFDRTLQSLNDYLRLISLGGVISVSIGALIAMTALLVSGFATPKTYFRELLGWWMGDMLGVILITPLILVCWQARNDGRGAKQMAEDALLLGLTFLVGQIVFLGWLHASVNLLEHVAKGYWIFLCIVWVAVRSGARVTVIALVMAAIQGLLGAYHGVGFFADDIAQTQLVNYWFYTLALSVVCMALATYISGQKRSEEALRRSETKFRTLYDSIGDAVHLMDETGFIDCNKATLAMCGCATKEEFCSKSPVDFSPPEQPCGTNSAALTERYIATAMETGSHRFDWVCKRFDNGKLFNIDVQLTAMKLDGKPVFLVVARDITGRIQAEEEKMAASRKIKQVQMMLQTVLDSTPDWIFAKDAEYRFLFVNRAFAAGQNCTPDDMIGRPDTDFWSAELCIGNPAKGIRGFHTDDDAAIAGKTIHNPNDIATLKEGKECIFDTIKLPLLNDDGDGYGVLGYARDITARKQVENSLRESEEFLRRAQHIAHIGHFKFNPASGVVEGSDELFRIFGLTKEQFQFSDFVGSVHPDDRDFDVATIESAIERKTGYEIEHRLLLRDGTLKWVRAVGQFIAASPEERSLLVGTVQDITAYKQIEESLRESKEKLRAYLDNISDTIWVVHANLDITYVSSGVTRLMGILPEESIGRPSAMYIHPDDMGAIGNAMQYLMEHPGEPRTVQYRVKHKDGRWIPVESTGINLLDNPAINGVLVAMRDITERKHIEDELRLTKERYDFATAIGKVGTWDWNPDTGALVWSNETFRLMGFAPGSITPSYELYLSLVHPADRAALDSAVQAALHDRKPYDLDCRIVLGSGKGLVCHVTGYVEFNAEDRPVRMLGTIQDITERKAIEQQLHDLSTHILDIREQEKSHIAREIHDELGGTLTALKIDTHWLLRKLPVNEETTAVIERVHSMSQRIDSAINTTRHIIDNMRPTILDDLGLLAAIEWQASEFQKNTGIECTVNCIEDEANLDNQRSIALFRILQEILTNASRHSGASRVEIEFHHRENEVILIVSDNGCGIPENHMAISKSYGSKSYGMLGMTERVKQLGGKIIFSRPKGGGFAVEVLLPLPAGDRSTR